MVNTSHLEILCEITKSWIGACVRTNASGFSTILKASPNLFIQGFHSPMIDLALNADKCLHHGMTIVESEEQAGDLKPKDPSNVQIPRIQTIPFYEN